ncbi:MAG: diphosphomevalonate/mevalonate 3,5-bisphosphate decarboxylase family protein [Chitinophagales bacterium]
MKNVKYEAPSNIALVKYWGKYGNQLPRNASISFTLTNCKSIFDIQLLDKSHHGIEVEINFEGKSNPKFAEKISLFFGKIAADYPIVNQYKFSIVSSNTFPHSSGIASSASSRAALAMCLEELQHGIPDLQRASSIARIGSGSASRSVIPKLGWWGSHGAQPMSSNEYAVSVWEETDEVFHNYQNAILIASSGEKSVSSSMGHELMNNHVFGDLRFQNANQSIVELYGAMREGDLEKWGEIVEYEALSLHALMMMSHPSFILMKPNSISMIEKIRDFRTSSKLPVYFTLDAGPNIHLLYPKCIEKQVSEFIKNDMEALCENGVWIQDFVGDGPQRL